MGSRFGHHRTVPWQLSVTRTLASRARLLIVWSSAVQKRRRVKQTSPLDQRLADQAQRLREEAKGTPPGVDRERLLRRARQAEAAAHMEQWLTSPGVHAPK